MKIKSLAALFMCVLTLGSLTINVLAEAGIPIPVDNVQVVCNECGAEVDHNEECSLYTPADPTEETAENTEATETTATTETTEATGAAEAPETAETAAHQKTETAQSMVDDTHQEGDKVWIKSGSYVYKSTSGNHGYEILLPHQITIEAVITNENGEAEWYEFTELTLNYLGYKYVHVDSTTEDEPSEDGEKETKVGDTDIIVQGVPETVTLTASAISKEQYSAGLDRYIDENSELLYAYDITLTNPDGSQWQPQSGQSVTVTLDFNGMGLIDGNVLKVLHEHKGELRPLGAYAIENGKLNFTTDGFSKFYFYITYTFGGHSFSMSGGDTIYLSDLLRELSISRSVSEVSSVQFTNPDVLKISKQGSDWKLESLAPFGDEETLTITFSDGETIGIAVKDPVIYNYAVGNSITNVPLLDTKNDTMDAVLDGDTTPQGKTYKTNEKVITNAELISAAGSAASVDIIVYAEPGMAIGFEAGTVWGDNAESDAFARPKSTDNEIWFWTWADRVNYAILKDESISAGKQATFPITAVSGNTKKTVNVTICAVTKSSPELLQNNLPDGYSIKNVPVTLYNYDGRKWNEHYNKNGEKYFAFASTVKGVNTTENAGNRGWTESGLQANGGGGVALMGIVKDKLVDGLPEMSQGQKVDLFSTNEFAGKKVYQDVKFQFVYNERTGYYNYNSALNHAQYNDAEKTIELYNQSLAASDTPNGASHGNAGFYPFADIHNAYTNTGYTALTKTEWIKKLEEDAFELLPSQYSADIALSSSANPASRVDLHYGIQVASDFYLPKGKTLNGKDMKFEFVGDDDLWVFIDGKLVLDIGGGHTHVSGSFNLTTGEVWVEKYTKLAAVDGGSYAERKEGTDLKYTDSFLTGLRDDQMHTIQIFYLERHAGVSNCLMRFNLPMVPSDAVNISKNLVNQDGKDLSVTPDVNYTFTLYTAEDNDDNVNATVFTAKANTSYTVIGRGAPNDIQFTDENGRFVLKDGWIASFSDIPRFTEVYVVESKPSDGYIYCRSTVSVNKSDATDYVYGFQTETKVMQLNSSINFDFVNYMQTQPLTVEKQVFNGTKGLTNPEQEFCFTLDFTKPILETGEGAISAYDEGENSVHLTDGGTFALKHGQGITLPRVPVHMTYELSESNPDTEHNSFINPVYTLKVGESEKEPQELDFSVDFNQSVQDGGENLVTIFNRQYVSLTIKKQISDSVNPDQSFMFNIKNDNGFNINLLIPVSKFRDGTATIFIKDLDVGTYTVTELTDWSWRYTLIQAEAPENNTAIVHASNSLSYRTVSAEQVVVFKNQRTQDKWLSGDSLAKNVFNKEANPGVTRQNPAALPKKEDDED